MDEHIQISKLLETKKRAMSLDELAGSLHLDKDTLLGIIQQCNADGEIVITPKGRYALPEQLGLIACRAIAGKNRTYARPLDDSVRASLARDIAVDTGSEILWPDDIIFVKVTSANGDHLSGKLYSIAFRAHKQLTVSLCVPPKEEHHIPHSKKYRSRPHRPMFQMQTTAIPQSAEIKDRIIIEGDTKDAVDGDIALITIIQYPTSDSKAVGVIDSILGSSDDIRVILRSIAVSHGFGNQFTAEAQIEASKLPQNVPESAVSGRLDLRDKLIFTIDGDDAQDFDDAVSLERIDDVKVLGVHIADVSHYVEKGSAIDAEAFARTTSVYFPGMTFPMLPSELCNDICSLRPGENRLTLSCLLTFKGGKIIDSLITPSVIRSSARLTYKDVNKLFKGRKNTVPDELHDVLFAMKKLSQTLRKERQSRGCIEFELPEPEFKLDNDGNPLGVYKKPRGDAENLIEDFMLAANETVARYAKEHELPFVYRVHEPPDSETCDELRDYLEAFERPIRIDNPASPAAFQKALTSVKGKPEEKAVNSCILRAMNKAIYLSMPHGHFALAARDYCHFTSPIRRYPDLTVHRILKRHISGLADNEWLQKTASEVSEIASVCSNGENEAATAEREADNRMRAIYMKEHIGEVFDVTVSGLNRVSMFVSLENTSEGRIPLRTLCDYYEYSDEMHCLCNEYGTKTIRIGDRFHAQLVDVNTVTGVLEFHTRDI